MKKKLIEVALPLDAINAASAREKSIRHGHPSTLHLWWARRPLATARAVLFASLVDDPSANPDKFPTPELQDAERQRLFKIVEDLVVWENSNNAELFKQAHEEILKSTGGKPPAVFDPFAGGGSIPLEAQRLGLQAVAADLNPVAVMINKAMIEIPAKFANLPPVNPDANSFLDETKTFQGAQGLAADIAYYGKKLKSLAAKKIGHLYPTVFVPQLNADATVIAWLWARTVKCPNPACGCQMPLVNSFWLSKKKDKEFYLEPVTGAEEVRFQVKQGTDCRHEGTVNRNGATCISCGAKVELKQIRDAGKAGKMSAQMIAIVAEGKNGRIYLAPDTEHIHAAKVPKPENFPDAEMPKNPRWFSPPSFGLENFSQLFTNRQLTALTTFSNLIPEVVKEISDKEYAKAIQVYLAFVIDRLVDIHSTICTWLNTIEAVCHTFSRQAIPMTWTYAEANPFSNSSGCFDNALEWIVENVQELPAKIEGKVFQHNAQDDNGFKDEILVSTDPPYYDNIGYADLSDFFYIWLRNNLKNIYPEIFSKMQTSKNEELIATPFRHDGSREKAKNFFEKGMAEVCKNLCKYSREDIPTTIYYAFKQKDLESDGEASTGWETMLTSIIKAGFRITGTLPMRTERSARTNAIEANSLASSIVLVCRKRPAGSVSCSQKNFRRELATELQTALVELQKANIAPVDMAQSAIGPGISVYSRYESVADAQGKEISVRDALKMINAELDEYLNGQGEKLDAATLFCVDLYNQCGFNEIAFGETDVLARARNISVDKLAAIGAVLSAKGKVRLVDRDELPLFVEDADRRKHLNKAWIKALSDNNCSWLFVQSLVEILKVLGNEGCAELLRDYLGNDESLKNLAYRLYQITEKRNWAKEGVGYNDLVVSWQDIMTRRAEILSTAEQQSFDM